MALSLLHLAQSVILILVYLVLLAPLLDSSFVSALDSLTPRRSSPIHLCRALWVNPRGADKGSCSESAPCASITFAFNSTVPGDVIHVSDGAYGEQLLSGVNGTEVAPILITGLGSNPICASITFDHVAYVILDGVHVHHSAHASVKLTASTHITLRNSEILSSAGYGIVGTNVSDLVLTNLTIDECGDHNIYLGGPTSDISLLHSRIFHSKNFGIHLDPYIYTIIASNSSTAEPPPTHLTRVMIAGNQWKGNGGGDITGAGWTNSSIINNVMYGPGCAVAIGPWEYVPGPSGLKIYHNTVHLQGEKGRSLCFTGIAGPVILRNNMFLSDGTNRSSSAVSWLDVGSTDDLAHVDSDWNLIGNIHAGNESFSLAQWQTRWGQDSHSVDVSLTDPAHEWVNPTTLSAGDYHLVAGALAIERGRFLFDVLFDFDGRWRGGHIPNVSLGAFEFVRASTLTRAGTKSSTKVQKLLRLLGGM